MTQAQEKQTQMAYLRIKAAITDLRLAGTPEAAIREAIRRLRDE